MARMTDDTSRDVIIRGPNGKTFAAELTEPVAVGYRFYCTEPVRGWCEVISVGSAPQPADLFTPATQEGRTDDLDRLPTGEIPDPAQ